MSLFGAVWKVCDPSQDQVMVFNVLCPVDNCRGIVSHFPASLACQLLRECRVSTNLILGTMKKNQMLHKATDAAMDAISEDLRQNSCGYAKMVIIRNSMISNLKESLDETLQNAE